MFLTINLSSFYYFLKMFNILLNLTTLFKFLFSENVKNFVKFNNILKKFYFPKMLNILLNLTTFLANFFENVKYFVKFNNIKIF